MLFRKTLLKLQCILDNAPLLHRVAISCGFFVGILMLWLFIIYFPQMHHTTNLYNQVRALKVKNTVLSQRNERVSGHIKTHDMDTYVTQYKRLKQEEMALEKKIENYHYRYVGDEVLSELLYSILKDINNVSIVHFSTVLEKNKDPAASSEAGVKPKPVDTSIKTATKLKHKLLLPEMTRYSLVLKGDYFAIMEFLQRVEQLKWQLFWNTFSYEVEQYPQAQVKIEFYTLKDPAQGATT